MTTPRRLRRPQPKTTRLATIARVYGVPMRLILNGAEYKIRSQPQITWTPQ